MTDVLDLRDGTITTSAKLKSLDTTKKFPGHILSPHTVTYDSPSGLAVVEIDGLYAPKSTPPPPPPPSSGPVSGVLVGSQAAKFDFVNDASALGRLSRSWFNGNSQNNIGTDPNNVVQTSNGIELWLRNGKGASINSNPQDAARPGVTFQKGYMEVLATFATLEGQQPSINYHSSNGADNGPSVNGNWLGAPHYFGINRDSQGNVYYDKILERSYTIRDNDAPHYFVANVGANGWCAVWATGFNWPGDGEDDVAEDYGSGRGDGLYLTLHSVTFWNPLGS